MAHTLYLDTATSRFHTDKATGEAPHLIRVAWWRDDEPEPVCRLIRPLDDITIDPSTVPYHRITAEHLQHGLRPSAAIEELLRAFGGTSAIVSFNADFHWRILRRMMDIPIGPDHGAVCAMKAAAPILAIPLMRPGGGFKSPSLKEACAYFDLPEPVGDDPISLALSTVRSVRGVYEMCQAAKAKDAG